MKILVANKFVTTFSGKTFKDYYQTLAMFKGKVTREMADYIQKSYKALRTDKVKSKKAFNLVHEDTEKKFGVKLGLGTVRFYSNFTFDELKEYRKNYSHSESFKKSIKKYMQKMVKPRNEKIAMILDVFNGLDVELTPKQVWEKVGGFYFNVTRVLNDYSKTNVLKKRTEDDNVFYRLDPDSPFINVVDGFFERKEKEIFGK